MSSWDDLKESWGELIWNIKLKLKLTKFKKGDKVKINMKNYNDNTGTVYNLSTDYPKNYYVNSCTCTGRFHQRNLKHVNDKMNKIKARMLK